MFLNESYFCVYWVVYSRLISHLINFLILKSEFDIHTTTTTKKPSLIQIKFQTN